MEEDPTSATGECAPSADDIAAAAQEEKQTVRTATSLTWNNYVDNVPVDVLQRARQVLWDTEMDEAERLTQQYRYTNMWAAQLWVDVAFWRSFFDQSEAMTTEALSRMGVLWELCKVVAKANKLRMRKPKNDAEVIRHRLQHEATAMRAYAQMSYSMIYFRDNKYVKGAYYLRKSWKEWEKALDMEQKLTAFGCPPEEQLSGLILFGVGFFHFSVSLTPPGLIWVTKLLGFTGDRKASVKELTDASAEALPKSTESTILLMAIHWFFTDDQEEAARMVETMRERHPNSVLITYVSGWLAQLQADMTKAIACYTDAYEQAKLDQMRLTSLYQLAYCHFLQLKIDVCVPQLEDYVDKTHAELTKSYAYYLIGVGYCIWEHGDGDGDVDNWPKASAAFKACIKWADTDSVWDAYAIRKSKEYLDNKGMNAISKLLIRAGNLCEGNEFQQALDRLCAREPLLAACESGKVKDMHALYYFYKGWAHKGLKQWDEARKCFRTTISFQKNLSVERHSVPYAWMFLGELETDTGMFDEAAAHFKACKACGSNYDYARLLSFRLTSDVEILEARRARAAKDQ